MQHENRNPSDPVLLVRKPQTRRRAWHNTAALSVYLERHETSQLAKKLGVSPGAIRDWVKNGQMPMVAWLALQYLINEEQPAAEKEGSVVVLVSLVDAEKAEAVELVLGHMGVTFQKMEVA